MEQREVVMTLDETIVNGKVYHGLDGFIKSQLDFLLECKSKRTSPNSEMLDRDIKVYEYILRADNSDELAEQYLKEAENFRKRGIYGAEKQQIAEALGWEIK